MKCRQKFLKLMAGSLAMALAVGAFTALPGRMPDASAEIIDAYGSISYNTDNKMYVYELTGYEFVRIENVYDTPLLVLQYDNYVGWGARNIYFDISALDEDDLNVLRSIGTGVAVDITFESRYFYREFNTVSYPSEQDFSSGWEGWDSSGNGFNWNTMEWNDDASAVNSEWRNSPGAEEQTDPFLNPDLGFDPEEDVDPKLKENYIWGGFTIGSSDLSYRMDKLISVKRLGIHYYGDINDDAVVDTFDLLDYKKYISGTLSRQLTREEFLNADIDGDEEISEEDLAQLSAFLLGQETGFNAVGEIGSVRLDNMVSVQQSEGKAADEKFAAAQMKFGVDILKKSFDPKGDDKNLLISPFSITSALSMITNGADNNTLSELENVLGGGTLSIDDINEYMAYYLGNLPDKSGEVLSVANSLWCKDSSAFKPCDSFLEANKRYYGAEIYKADFGMDTVKDVNSWVNKNTNGMIPKIADKKTFTQDTVLALINALYFDMDWAKKYDTTVDGKFTDLDGVTHNIKEMRSTESLYYETEDADIFKKPYVNDDYYFVGIMPRDKDVVQYIKDLDSEKLSEALTKPYQSDEYDLDLQVMIPEFDYNYSIDLPEILKDLGVKDAFSPAFADFSRLYDQTVPGSDNVYIEKVIHKTKIEVSKTGTKAAAATLVGAAMGGMSMRKIRHVVIRLDKPFVYMIVDKNNVPIFVGAATQLGTD